MRYFVNNFTHVNIYLLLVRYSQPDTIVLNTGKPLTEISSHTSSGYMVSTLTDNQINQLRLFQTKKFRRKPE